MTDTARLQIRVQSDEVSTADGRLKSLARTGSLAEKATDGITSAFRGLLAPVAATVTALGGLNKLVDVQRQFDVLNAGLITATGSSEKASIAFQAIQDFASKTPYDLSQAVDGFTKLVNLGLTPSERALTSYGNTASAMGKDLNQMIEAVADAATGEFERLKEFGIKAKNQGDTISFTFQGVTTSVGNNAEEIESYLMRLGEVNFAGAMQTRMDSLDGALSNLSDTWDGLFRAISEQGVGDVIESTVRTATSALQELTDMVSSGEIEGYLSVIASSWSGWSRDVKKSVSDLGKWMSEEWGNWEEEATSAVDFLVDAFQKFPQNVKAFIQLMVVEVAAGLDKVKAYGSAFVDGIEAIFNDQTWEGVGSKLEQELQIINSARDSSIESILEVRDADVSATEQQITAVKKLREERLKLRQDEKAESEDRLAQFKVGGSSSSSSPVDKAAETENKRRRKEFESLVDSLRTEEEAIQQSYLRRKAIIEQNTLEESSLRSDLMARLDKERDGQVSKLQESKSQELNALKESLLTEEEAINESYRKRLDIILKNTEQGSALQAELRKKLDQQYSEEMLGQFAAPVTYEDQVSQINVEFEARRTAILENTRITEEQRSQLEEQLTRARNQKLEALEKARQSSILQGGAAMFDGLAGLAEGFAGKQSAAYRVMFAASKAFAIADAMIKIQQGIASAASLPWPANLAAMASTLSATGGIISNIQSINYAGAFDKGGSIPSGQVGIVAEKGSELVNGVLVKGPARVTSREETAQMMSGGGISLTVINNTPAKVSQEYRDDGQGGKELYLFIDQVEETLANRVDNKQGALFGSIRDNFALTPKV